MRPLRSRIDSKVNSKIKIYSKNKQIETVYSKFEFLDNLQSNDDAVQHLIPEE